MENFKQPEVPTRINVSETTDLSEEIRSAKRVGKKSIRFAWHVEGSPGQYNAQVKQGEERVAAAVEKEKDWVSSVSKVISIGGGGTDTYGAGTYAIDVHLA